MAPRLVHTSGRAEKDSKTIMEMPSPDVSTSFITGLHLCDCGGHRFRRHPLSHCLARNRSNHLTTCASCARRLLSRQSCPEIQLECVLQRTSIHISPVELRGTVILLCYILLPNANATQPPIKHSPPNGVTGPSTLNRCGSSTSK